MPSLHDYLLKFFAYCEQVQHQLSERWRQGTNVRTMVILILIGILSALVYLNSIQPPDDFPIGELVTVPTGSSLTKVADSLYEQHVIRSTLAFRALITVFGQEHKAHAGDYLFKEPVNVWTVARAVAIGAFGLEPARIRIPEGATTKQMSLMFPIQLLRFNSAEFLAKAQPREGYFFPDTYFFLPNASADDVISTMSQNFDTHIAGIQKQIDAFGKPLNDVIIMASIIEREARNTHDRQMIAGVLWHRLRIGMPLQVDVTFLYTLGKGTFQLTMSDLKSQSPYNTYTRKGLPPTPIGSPSMDSILAAINPIKSPYLFWLADNHGITHYAKTYEEQVANKRLYFNSQ